MTIQTTSTVNPTITQGRKFDQVRDGATVIFLRDGFAGASVDDIARSARVSKATLYSYFPDKTVMFQEVLRAVLDSAFREPAFETDPAGRVTTALPQVLASLGDWLTAQPRLSLLRLVAAESQRFPDAAQAHDRATATRVTAPLSRLIDAWIETGQLAPHDSAESARQMVALMIGRIQLPAMLSGKPPAPAALTDQAERMARLFLAAHRPA